MDAQVCPFHSDEFVRPARMDDGSWMFVCEVGGGHPQPGPHRWLVAAPQAAGQPGLSGLAEEFGLDVELPAALTEHRGRWVEYGLVERAYARRRPEDFTRLVTHYGHRELAPSQYTASAFLAHTLGRLAKGGSVALRFGPATGRWSYNSTISWWTLLPSPDWTERLSWADTDLEIDYLPTHR